MKRVIVLAIILIGIFTIPLISSSNGRFFFQKIKFPNSTLKDSLKKDRIKKWEYLKTRLLPIGGNRVQKFTGPILVSLENASDTQRVWAGEIVQEIQHLIPNKKISLYKDYTGFTSQEVIDSVSNSSVLNDLFDLYVNSISVTFGEKPSPNTDYIEPVTAFPKLNTSILSDSTVIKRNNTWISGAKDIKGAVLSFNFSNRTSLEQQKKYFKYELLRSLCYTANEEFYKGRPEGFFIRYNNMFLFSMNRDNGVFGSYEYTPEDYDFNTFDRFLLQKMYSDDFQVQFKAYMSEAYSKLYQYNFFHRATTKKISEILIILLGAFIFILSISLLHKRRFKFGPFNYLIPILLLNLSFLGLWNLKTFLQLDFMGFMYLQVATLGFIVKVIYLSLIQSFCLWLIEYLLMRKTKGFTLNVILKVILTFSSFVIPYFYFSGMILPFANGILLISLVISFLRGLYMYLNHYSESIIQKKDLEMSQLKELQLTTELNSLHAQINPHFLYNALNSIASLAHIDSHKTEKMALSLSDLFRYSVNRKGEKMSTIQDEVTMVENYLEIEQVRFEDQLEFSLEVESPLLKRKIPRFVLQPLIENAVKHGVLKIKEKGHISLHIYEEHNKLLIEISDNGPDFPEGLISGHGLQSVFDLLRLSYGEQASMNWENLPKKKIIISIHSNS